MELSVPVDGGHLGPTIRAATARCWCSCTLGGATPQSGCLSWRGCPRTTALSGMTPAVSGIRLPQLHRSARWTTWPQYWITAILIWRSWLGTAAVAARRSGLRAFEAERRRIERDLYDGAQQRHVALSIVIG